MSAGAGGAAAGSAPGQPPQPPEGYLGTAARITSGPAPELVEAGYALEIADAPLLHRGLTVADLAHLVELVECGALRPDEAAPLCTALLALLKSVQQTQSALQPNTSHPSFRVLIDSAKIEQHKDRAVLTANIPLDLLKKLTTPNPAIAP